ncbi:MAG: RdgB/HAM1 family non-canonical purine NTP pyrophosphatase [Candidatus Omnitrophica bacterium]|nr:RdgB/HAM1 family non-canonical purine NTP pyrophosphatase [Candidatus Omnitrophota bacterium]
MKKIVLASRNRKKARELQEILNGLPYEIVTLEAFPDCPEVIEDGETFEANSAKKAAEVSAFTGLWAVADDSGIAVDALGGEPGVYSARYGDKETDEERNEHLLENLQGVPDDERTGRFVCCASLYGEGKLLYQVTETVEGRILHAERGEGGFGYDPLFLPDGFEVTTAEMTPEQKHQISHRGKALRKVKEFLESLEPHE